MENYQGIVQDIVMIGEGEYRVTFRAYNGHDLETHFWENEDVPFTLYSMIAKRKENDYSLVAEGALTDCINVLYENESVETVGPDEIDKWEIGVIATDIASSLADSGMFTTCSVDD